MGKVLLAVHVFLFASTVIAENNGLFPSDFLFGVGISAYQTEGAWDVDGRGESIWDRWIHDNASHIANNDTANAACDFYRWYQSDINRAALFLNAAHFQFSISWSRVLPNGYDINVKGILYYKSLIAEIVNNGMIPVATLYHYDLPQPLQDIGGWTNPEMVNYFVKYARTAFQNFDKVGYWLTFHDPRSVCRLGYGEGVHAPGLSLDGIGEYICSYVLVKSHAAAYHTYKTEYPHLTAKMSIAIDLDWSEPASDSTDDIEAVERRNSFEFGLYADPIYKGNWPQLVIDRVAYRSNKENFTKSRLPKFNQEEIDYINGTFDFMAINIFRTNLVADITEPEYGDPGYMKDMKAELSVDPHWNISTDGNAITPWSARKSLIWLKDTYNNPEIFITGNGVSDEDDASVWRDNERIAYYNLYLDAILDAIVDYNVNVFGYTAWSLLNCFEWTKGYSEHYGFYNVDETALAMRTGKYSSFIYGSIAKTHRIHDAPTTTTTSTTPTSTQPPTTTSSTNKITLYPLFILVIITFLYSLF